jgi:hypothetical protein
VRYDVAVFHGAGSVASKQAQRRFTWLRIVFATWWVRISSACAISR